MGENALSHSHKIVEILTTLLKRININAPYRDLYPNGTMNDIEWLIPRLFAITQ